MKKKERKKKRKKRRKQLLKMEKQSLSNEKLGKRKTRQEEMKRLSGDKLLSALSHMTLPLYLPPTNHAGLMMWEAPHDLLSTATVIALGMRRGAPRIIKSRLMHEHH
ncbi:hypothetical protein E2C01_086533 [Portunus trituberculatus]|uniref:Uncharacterized protein n=1 Tax=Portunus trituberculatus TaxID=210409 RepID=A0A5B7JAK8_PORTR|nr:hypothetical protein [Portunus trituberculatus]